MISPCDLICRSDENGAGKFKWLYGYKQAISPTSSIDTIREMNQGVTFERSETDGLIYAHWERNNEPQQVSCLDLFLDSVVGLLNCSTVPSEVTSLVIALPFRPDFGLFQELVSGIVSRCPELNKTRIRFEDETICTFERIRSSLRRMVNNIILIDIGHGTAQALELVLDAGTSDFVPGRTLISFEGTGSHFDANLLNHLLSEGLAHHPERKWKHSLLQDSKKTLSQALPPLVRQLCDPAKIGAVTSEIFSGALDAVSAFGKQVRESLVDVDKEIEMLILVGGTLSSPVALEALKSGMSLTEKEKQRIRNMTSMKDTVCAGAASCRISDCIPDRIGVVLHEGEKMVIRTLFEAGASVGETAEIRDLTLGRDLRCSPGRVPELVFQIYDGVFEEGQVYEDAKMCKRCHLVTLRLFPGAKTTDDLFGTVKIESSLALSFSWTCRSSDGVTHSGSDFLRPPTILKTHPS